MYESQRFVRKFLIKNKFELLPRHSCSPPQLRSARKAAAPYSLTGNVRAKPLHPKLLAHFLYVVFILSAASRCSLYFLASFPHSTTFGVHHLASSLLLDTSHLYATIQGQAPAWSCSTLAPPCALGTRPAPLSKVLIFLLFFLYGFAISNVACTYICLPKETMPCCRVARDRDTCYATHGTIYICTDRISLNGVKDGPSRA